MIFWRRIIDFRRISLSWYAVIFLYVPIKSGLAAVIDILLGGKGIEPEALTRLVEQPLLDCAYPILLVALRACTREPGWRGYALDGLEMHRSALAASLIIGVV